MDQWTEDHQPELLEEEWFSEEEVIFNKEVKGLVEEEEVFQEYMKERVRVVDAVQLVPVSPEGTTEAPAGNKRPVVVGGVVEGGTNGDWVTVSSTKPAPNS